MVKDPKVAVKKIKTTVKKPAAAKKTVAKPKAAVKAAKTEVKKTTVKPIAKKVVVTKITKAGKHSAKTLREEAALAAKEARKKLATEDGETASPKPAAKAKHNPPRPKHLRKGKKYRAAYELIDREQTYELKAAVGLVIKTSTTKFDSSVDVHLRLNVDPKLGDQNIRGVMVLPHGTGKVLRIAVYSEAADLAKAKKAGADIALADEFLQQLDKGLINFDILIASPAVMPKLAKYARILGPKGLMPNPKSGTVSADVAKAVNEARVGKIEYRVDSTGIVHATFGKVSFGAEKLQANAEALLASIKQNRPGGIKGGFIKSLYLTTSMGPAVPVAVADN